jgi:thymidine phosphorylase
MPDVIDLIRTKRDGGMLADDDIRWLIDAYTGSAIAEEQMSALLMAIVFRSLTAHELSTWTAAMIDSGERLDLSSVTRPTVDKHSTGGVGDKVSLVLCPLVAACGAAVPQLSGRGLGHTGGTLDKMEAIPGWSAQLSNEQMIEMLETVGCFIAAAGVELAPADRKLYALRDVTGTVESIPLIASSIMSKKIAEGTEALVLNTTFGSGSFLRDVDVVRELARTMVDIGAANGVRSVARLTAMETVLGRAAGNGLEVAEAVECLRGGGPADLREVVLQLARDMLDLVGIDADPAAVLASGKALTTWEFMVGAQGGDPGAALPTAVHRTEVVADRSGVVTRLDCRAVGIAAWRLGAGRARQEDPVSPGAGIVCRVKPGEEVRVGDVVLELHTDDRERFESARRALEPALTIGDRFDPDTLPPLIADLIG